MCLGAGLVLAWAGLLPVNLAAFDPPRGLFFGAGAILFLSGTAVVTHLLTKPRPPD
jgi:hypothetical protein